MSKISSRLAVAAAIPLICMVSLVACGCSSAVPTDATTTTAATVSGDAVLARAFAERTSGLEVEGQGAVERLLADDTSGERHQRFIVRLASGQTLLIAHNIDVAPRVEGLQAGDPVSFKGEYVWNAEGGLVHWTHRDPGSGHVAGWIKYRGKTYQ
jgi:ABC-type glycerol-3-phosphate transport system substrate-binding protein